MSCKRLYHLVLAVCGAFVATSLALPQSAGADCICASIPAPMEGLKRADVAFIGSVQRVSKSAIKTGFLEVKFSIMRRLKGFEEIPGDSVFVYTKDVESDPCGYPFAEGQDYLVFGKGNPAGLKTGTCDGTNFLDSVDPVSRDYLLRIK